MRAAERLALAHIGERLGERRLAAAERAGADVEPAAVEPGHGDLEAFALGADAIAAAGTRDALHDHLPRRLGVPAHLALVGAEGEAGRPLLDQEGRDAAGARLAGARHDEIEVGRRRRRR